MTIMFQDRRTRTTAAKPRQVVVVPQPTPREPQHIVVNGHRLDAPEPQAVLNVPGAWATGWFTVRRRENESLTEFVVRCEDLSATEQGRQDKAARGAARCKQPLGGADGRVMRKREGKRQHSQARSVRPLESATLGAPRIRGGDDSSALVVVAD